GRVNTAGQRRDDTGVADLLADALDLLGDDVAAVPVGWKPGRLVQEVLDDRLTVVGVLHLGVPLHAVEAALRVTERGDRSRGGGGEHVEALRRAGDLVAVAHPDVLLHGLTAQQHAAVTGEIRVGGAVLAEAGVGVLAAAGECDD